MKNLFISVFILINSLFSAGYDTPSRSYPSIVADDYSWMLRNKDVHISVRVSKDAKQFFTNDSLLRYFKLKMRNFIKEKNIQGKIPTGSDYMYMGLSLDLYRYNDATKIYYGLLEFTSNASIYSKGSSEKQYRISYPVAGSDRQIIDSIKKDIDYIVETFADDYFYVEDLVNKKK